MFLSPAECFIVGRIAAGWPVECRAMAPLLERRKHALSLLRVIDRAFDEFGLERCVPPTAWWDRAADLPGDVAWRVSATRERTDEPLPIDEGHPGVPAVAIGVSPSEPGTLFLERCDGRICGWRIAAPRSGFYGLLLRRLRPIIGLSPQVWLMLHEGPWPQTVDDWRQLRDFDPSYPHMPSMVDPPGNVVDSLAGIADESGHAAEFRLGKASGTVEHELRHAAAAIGCRPEVWMAIRRFAIPEEERVVAAFRAAKEVLTSAERQEVARADHLAAALYREAEAIVDAFDGDAENPVLSMMIMMLVHGHASRAGMYLYGRLHGGAE